MGYMFKLIISVAIAILSLYNESDAFSTYNVSIQRQPQKTFEIIQVTLPENTENPGRLVDDVKEFYTHGEPRYEILIKPSNNRQNSTGGRKIKIFVESEDYNNEKQSSKNSSRTDVSQHNYQPMPLAIHTAGLNVDTFQYNKLDKENSTRYVKPVMHEVKQIYKPNNDSDYVQKLVSKTVHSLRDIPERVTVYGDDYTPQRNEEREKRNKFKSNSERGSVLGIKPAEEFRSSHVPITNYGDTGRQIYRSGQQEQSRNNNPYGDVTDLYERETHSANQPSYNREAGVKKVLVFEPDAGISIAKVDSVHPDHIRGQTVGSTHDLDYDRTMIPSGSSVTNINEGRTDHTYLGHNMKNPGRNAAEHATYHEIRQTEDGKYINSDYSREATSYSLSNGRGTLEEGYSSDRKTVYDSKERYPYAEQTGDSSVLYTGSPYEITPQTTHSNQGGRPVRQDTYEGFPESYSPNTEQFSRPNSYAGSNSPVTSPCENVFKYTLFENDRWYAEIFVMTDEVLTGMRLDIILQGRADLMTPPCCCNDRRQIRYCIHEFANNGKRNYKTDYSEKGRLYDTTQTFIHGPFIPYASAVSDEVKTHDNVRFTVLSLKKTLVPDRPEKVEVMVKYNADGSSPHIPFIKTIDLNGRKICPSRLNSYQHVTTTRRPVHAFPSEVQEPKRTTERNPYNRPAVINEFPSATRRTTSKPFISTKKTTPPTDYIPAHNPDYYEQPNPNRITTSKPVPNRPHIVNKPSIPGGSSTDAHGLNPVPVNSEINNNNRRPNDREKRQIPCGKPAVQPRPLITNGQMTTRGQWPWHIALYINAVPDLKYICGGSLVTANHIVTAAHCVTREKTSTPLEPNMLLVYLGKHNLKAWNEHGSLSRDVSRVTVHPDFNVTNFRGDIAVLTLSQKVEFNDLIRPVCLWDKRSTRIDDVVGLEGTVVGWGFDETKQLTEELKQAKMPVVSQKDCLWSYPEFYPKFTHNSTYCAGFKNGTSVCNGDSGGGMFFPIKINREERWFLRGLVSLSPGEVHDKICDVRHYVVFADSAMYLPWLEDILSRV